MSVKRQATTELNHDNWDQDDPADHEEMGTYKTAPKDVLEKRVIRTAKRRSQMATGDEVQPNKSVFSGFGGFNKTQPASFDFLANLTNGNKTNGSESSKTDNAVSSSIFGNKSTGDSTSSAFGSPGSTSAPASTFGAPSTQSSSLFAVSTPTTTSSLFTASKADSTVGNNETSKPSSSHNTPNLGGFSFTAKSNVNVSTSQVSSSMFGTSATSTSKPSSSTATTNSNSTPFKIQSVSSTTTSNVFGTNSVKTESKEEKKNDNPKKLTYYSKLKGLNESVSDWIKKHVEETPLCILTPIFKDYENHLKVIQDEYESGDKDDKKKESSKNETNTPLNDSSGTRNDATISAKAPTSNLFSGSSPSSNAGSLFTQKSNINPAGDQASTPFSFGIKTSPATNTSTPPSSSFSFGINKPASEEKAAAATPFSLSTNTFGTNSSTPFSFGVGQSFSFSSNTQKTDDTNEKKTENGDEDEPPKVEFTPVVEENSVFEKRCKIFVKKDGNFADKGVGTLYIKKIEDSGKHQLIVRANTNLGTVLVNLVLGSAIPTQRMGKNNVMMVCIPTPDSAPPPTPILIRVKTAEEADDLLETLNKYKA